LKKNSSQLTFNLYPTNDFHYADQALPLLAVPQTLTILQETTVVAPLFTVTESQAKMPHPSSAIFTHILIDHTHLKYHTHFNFIIASRE
jgi:hypothetical protein